MPKDCITVWNNCLNVIKENIPEQSFKTWFEPIVPLKLEGTVLTIQVPSQFFYEWIEEHYIHLLRIAIDKELGTTGRLEYSIIIDKGNDQSRPYTVNIQTAKVEFDKNAQKSNKINTSAKKKQDILKEYESFFRGIKFNFNYTFDNFVEGDCNRLARSAGYAVAKKPGVTAFNPLMLYGGVGLGKTHLVQAIGNHIRNNQQEKVVVYVSSEKFTNQFIEELKNNNLQKLTNFYLQMDVLIIDDVQFLSGKEKTQEMFFHIFNHLHQQGKQIVMTSDRPPIELQGFQDRLLSRFKCGLTADFQQPDFETRMAIIHRKLQSEGIELNDEIIEYLAHSIDSNIRELEGVIVSLMAQSSLNKLAIDLPLCKQVVQQITQASEKHPDVDVGIDLIQKVVCDYFSISPEILKSKSRKKEIAMARQIAMYFCKEYTNFSLKSIGYHFGGRDHSTVIHAIQNISDLRENDGDMKATVQEISDLLKGNR
ncbi:MAG: chromosomal replication initiator protein DnaA [Thermonemataceae bacterium]